MDIQIYNTLTRRKELFRPIEPGKLSMYNCGPTVYDQAHIGNMRSYIMADLIRRTFEFLGFSVVQVINITDVGHLTFDADEGEDRMLVGARRIGKDPWQIAEPFTELFFEDTASLNIRRPHMAPRATKHIPEMIAFVQRLEARGYTYDIHAGVYFDVGRLESYGRLSRQNLEDVRAGARVDVARHKMEHLLGHVESPNLSPGVVLPDHAREAALAAAHVKNAAAAERAHVFQDQGDMVDAGVNGGGEILLVTGGLIEAGADPPAQLRAHGNGATLG